MVKALIVAHGFVFFIFLPLKKKNNPGRWRLATCLCIPGFRAGRGGCRQAARARVAPLLPKPTTKLRASKPCGQKRWICLAQEMHNACSRWPKPSCFTIAERETSTKKGKKTLKNNQTEAEKQVRGCYRKARYKRVKNPPPSPKKPRVIVPQVTIATRWCGQDFPWLGSSTGTPAIVLACWGLCCCHARHASLSPAVQAEGPSLGELCRDCLFLELFISTKKNPNPKLTHPPDWPKESGFNYTSGEAVSFRSTPSHAAGQPVQPKKPLATLRAPAVPDWCKPSPTLTNGAKTLGFQLLTRAVCL